MNKKFSTLVAGLFVAGMMPVGAMVHHTNNGEVPYRTDMVKSAVSPLDVNGVKAISEGLWYQLAVNKVEDDGSDQMVLTMERNYSTGELTLKAVKIEEAALTHSLWKITTIKDNVNGEVLFAFENKETGYKLTFDEFSAVNLKGAQDAALAVKTEDATVMHGCTDNWRWYTTPAQAHDNFGMERVFSYFHAKDSVMAMALNDNKEVVLVKESKERAQDKTSRIKNLLTIQPIVAGAKVLSAAEINSMIDADDSYKNFKNIAKENTSYNDSKLAGTKVNFKFSKTLGENPLTATYEAVASPYTVLNREGWVNSLGNPEQYSGYDILLKNKKTGKYLMVTADRFEKPTAPGLYGGLLLKDSVYTKLNVKAAPTAVEVVDDLADLGSDISGIDAHQARYHFKFTYYPTNDSLVIEPLNASVKEKESDNYFTSDLVRKGAGEVTMKDYFNTVNEGIAYTDGGWGNVLFNKAKGVPVALGAINNGSGDPDMSEILTVSVPANVAAAQLKYQTLCKEIYNCSKSSEAGNPAYVTNYCENHVGDMGKVEYVANMGVKIGFNHDYNYLTRTTVPAGLYYIQLSTKVQNDPTYTEKRHNGSYIVADMAGHFVYDVLEGNQDFAHMPAMRRTVSLVNCIPLVRTRMATINISSLIIRIIGMACGMKERIFMSGVIISLATIP